MIMTLLIIIAMLMVLIDYDNNFVSFCWASCRVNCFQSFCDARLIINQANLRHPIVRYVSIQHLGITNDLLQVSQDTSNYERTNSVRPGFESTGLGTKGLRIQHIIQQATEAPCLII